MFNGLLTLVGYLIPSIFLGSFLTHWWEVKGVHTLCKGIDPKGNEKAQLKFKLLKNNIIVLHKRLIRFLVV